MTRMSEVRAEVADIVQQLGDTVGMVGEVHNQAAATSSALAELHSYSSHVAGTAAAAVHAVDGLLIAAADALRAYLGTLDDQH